MTSVSVVIPTFNRASMLARVLPSYLSSAMVSEVIIVDDGSSEQTEEIVNQIVETDARVRLIKHSQNLGRTYARNTGIERARSELVLISEDDLALAPQSLEMLAAHMQLDEADIIAGRRIWMRLGESEEQALSRANKKSRPVMLTLIMEHNSDANLPHDVQSPLVNATMLVHRNVFDKVKYANCYPGNSWREDSDFQLTAQELGFKVFYCPHALNFHHGRPMAGGNQGRIRSDLEYFYWIMKNNLTFLRRHREYLMRTIPNSLVFGSPMLTMIPYCFYRSIWLIGTEIRRAHMSQPDH